MFGKKAKSAAVTAGTAWLASKAKGKDKDGNQPKNSAKRAAKTACAGILGAWLGKR